MILLRQCWIKQIEFTPFQQEEVRNNFRRLCCSSTSRVNGHLFCLCFSCLERAMQEALQEKQDAIDELNAMKLRFKSLRFDQWSDSTVLLNSISTIEHDIRTHSFGVEPTFPDTKQFSSQIETLVHMKFARLEQLIQVLHTKIAKLTKYPRQSEIESKYGSIDHLLLQHESILEENEILKRREIRYEHQPLLKRRIWKECSQQFLVNLVMALQNELR